MIRFDINEWPTLPKAYKTTSNSSCIIIAFNSANDAVAWLEQWTIGEVTQGKMGRNWAEIKYTPKGRAYFMRNGRREYLDGFVAHTVLTHK